MNKVSIEPLQSLLRRPFPKKKMIPLIYFAHFLQDMKFPIRVLAIIFMPETKIIIIPEKAFY
jgi:hypothetical protein